MNGDLEVYMIKVFFVLILKLYSTILHSIVLYRWTVHNNKVQYHARAILASLARPCAWLPLALSHGTGVAILAATTYGMSFIFSPLSHLLLVSASFRSTKDT